MTDVAARLIAIHLPQFHPVRENDEWWGKGFTEWTNTAKAKPLFKGHYQPHVPADLGFYDLRLPEARAAQAEMAKAYGVEAFCYYHYWFGGREILERPVREIVKSGEPDFPFCICWANETWTGIWHGSPKTVLLEQTYPGDDDHREHFESLLPALSDPRYVRVDDKPLFVIYQPTQLPDATRVWALWRKWAVEAGMNGLYICGMSSGLQWSAESLGLDARISWNMPSKWISRRNTVKWLKRELDKRRGIPQTFDYDTVAKDFWAPLNAEEYPTLIPNWDNSPRSGVNSLVLTGSTPEGFRRHLRRVKEQIKARPATKGLVFIKSWNEWAEGNHLEPDLVFGRKYLETLRDEFPAE